MDNNNICNKYFKLGALDLLGKCEECADPMPKLLLIYGGTASFDLFDIRKDEGFDTSIVVYERTYENRDMSTYVKLDKDDLFLKCKFISCTNTDVLRTHDCQFIDEE